jgi:predicted nucleotidyltransferase
MGAAHAPIGDALFGSTRQAVLQLLLRQPSQRFYLRQIIRALKLGSGAVQRELQRLAACGILARKVEGSQTYFQADSKCPVFEELRGLVRKTFGVAEVLRDAIAGFAADIRLAFIYGSVAGGTETAGSDVDLMLVGDRLSLDQVMDAIAVAQKELAREVNPTVYRTAEFRSKLAQGHHFLARVISGPKMFVIGDENELTRLARVRMGARASGHPAGSRRSVGGR